MKKIIILFIVLIGLTATVSLLIFRHSLYGTSTNPAELVNIPANIANLTAQDITNMLYNEHIINNKRFFLFLIKKNYLDKKIKAGIYKFGTHPYIKDVIRKLIKGEIAYLKITIPEGSTCKEIGGILENSGVCSQDGFEKMCKKNKLEGFLFPDTYDFPLQVSKEAVADKMRERFRDKIKTIYPEAENPAKSQATKKYVIIASIVEKEAAIDSERPLIASVFYNRLKKGMLLQSCATVEYVIGNKKNLSLSDIKIRSPYNTYMHKGLPPAPICNPGFSSLEAAISPAKTNYLFFVSKRDGSSYFSSNYHQHNIAKDYYENLENERSEVKTHIPSK